MSSRIEINFQTKSFFIKHIQTRSLIRDISNFSDLSASISRMTAATKTLVANAGQTVAYDSLITKISRIAQIG